MRLLVRRLSVAQLVDILLSRLQLLISIAKHVYFRLMMLVNVMHGYFGYLLESSETKQAYHLAFE